MGYRYARGENYKHLSIIADGWKRPIHYKRYEHILNLLNTERKLEEKNQNRIKSL